ncbi:hypothetical protein [Promicromonospora panici]|uniref:hypothetical protein n=1 Tax=Promicromonospora panici TaxID=2219658 RepID=UPI00101E2157|nr:hypothetical protein [Promicromonospora panici]
MDDAAKRRDLVETARQGVTQINEAYALLAFGGAFLVPLDEGLGERIYQVRVQLHGLIEEAESLVREHEEGMS